MKKIFISGYPKTGKTTIIKRLIEEFGKEIFCGFWVEELRSNKQRVGFKIISTWDDEDILAHKEYRTPYRVGKYFVRKEVIDRFSKKYLEFLNNNENKIYILDEIGRMEFYSDIFKSLVSTLLKSDVHLIAIVHRKYVYMVPYYYWINNNWWDIYNKVRKFVKAFYLKNA